MDPEEAQRKAWARQLVERNPQLYSDVRRFTTVKAISKRLQQIETMMLAIPAHRRQPSDKRWRKLHWEKQMLAWKRQIYGQNRRALPLPIQMLRMTLECTDRHYQIELSPEEDAEHRVDHAAQLLYVVMRLRPLERVQAMVEGGVVV